MGKRQAANHFLNRAEFAGAPYVDAPVDANVLLHLGACDRVRTYVGPVDAARRSCLAPAPRYADATFFSCHTYRVIL